MITKLTGMDRWMQYGCGVRQLLILILLLTMSPLALAESKAQISFTTPEAGIGKLVDAVKTNKKNNLRKLFGPQGSKLISSGDSVADQNGRTAFLKAYNESNKLVYEGNTKAVLVLGKKDWPFPIPLVKIGSHWVFDTAEGEREILDRRIGRNELEAIQVILAIVDAEREYAVSQRDPDGVTKYAARIVSAPGKRDGLYWPTEVNESPSPLGPFVAAAANEGYTPERAWGQAPYRGYFYRILTSQGKDAQGGEYEYFIKNKMIGGFAVIAYPARYGASGIKTFMVNHDGWVFEKDLGQDTEAVATRINKYNPDASWKRVEPSLEK